MEAGPFKYLAALGSRRKFILCESKTQESILAAFQIAFAVEGNYLVQSYCEEFSEFVDIDDFSSLPDKGKLNFIREESEQSALSISTSSIDSTPSTPVVDLQPSESTSPSTPKPFPIVYHLPHFGNLQHDMKHNPCMILQSQSLRSNIVSKLYEDISQYGMYPSSRNLTVAISTLLRQFPGLRDKSNQNLEINYNAHLTWEKSLITKFKYERSKMVCATTALDNSNADDFEESEGIQFTLQKMRQKYGGQKGKKRPQSQVPALKARRLDTQIPMIAPHGETEDTLSQHRLTIQNEWRKQSPDLNLIQSRMECTKAHRQRVLHDTETTVDSVLDMYPVLRDCMQLIQDCERMTGVNIQKNREVYLTSDRITELIKKLGRKPKTNGLLSASKDSTPDRQMARVCGLMPFFFREDVDLWLLINKRDKVQGTPVVVAEDASSELDSSPTFSIYLDKTMICDNAPTVPLAIDALISVYYLWDVAVPKPVSNTVRFYAEIFGNLKSTTNRTATMQSLLNSLQCCTPVT